MKMNRLLNLRFMAGLVALLLTFGTQAAETEPFTEERFKALQAEGTPVLVEVHAEWCSTCAKQGEILAEYQAAHPDSDLVILRVDFDNQKEWVHHFKAPRQSTFILYQGDERVWFSVAETDRDTIFAALNQSE